MKLDDLCKADLDAFCARRALADTLAKMRCPLPVQFVLALARARDPGCDGLPVDCWCVTNLACTNGSYALRRLEAAGMITVKAHGTDGRCRIVRITDAARKLVEKLEAAE